MRAATLVTISLSALLGFGMAVTSSFGQNTIPATVKSASENPALHGGEFSVPINKSQVLKVSRSFSQALIGNPEIADILPMTDNSLYALGKKLGSTSLTLYDRNKQLLAVVDLVVGPDTEGLKRKLIEIMPDEKIGVRMSNDSVVLSGKASSASAMNRAAQIAETYAPGKVVNLASVGAIQQVMLEVRFSEMKRSTAKEIGVSNAFLDNDGNFFGVTGPRALGSSIISSPNGKPLVTFGPGLTDIFGTFGSNFDLAGLNITSMLDALEAKGLVTTLAEPNLVALSGETASFLAGGEFPIPVNSESTGTGRQITVQFKQFGVSLSFTPTILEDGLISLIVNPEVSSIDPAASITLDNLVIPGLRTRRAKTTLELRDGQSFAIAGLMRNDFEDTVRQFPLLGNIPILGALFRSTNFKKEETELVIIVTPRLVRPVKPSQIALPTDKVKAPHELELFMLGKTESNAASTAPSTGGHIIR
jgi:pilus assembly protein CpaC